MPRGDGSGPNGTGSMTGRQMGFCAGNKQPGFTLGNRQFMRTGNRRRPFFGSQVPYYPRPTKESLKEEMDFLEEQLKTTKARYSSFNE